MSDSDLRPGEERLGPPPEGELEKPFWETRTLEMGFGDGLLYGMALILILFAGLGMALEEGGGAAAVFGVALLCAVLLAFKLGLEFKERP